MKKYNYLLLLSAVTATTAFTSCDEDKLEIPQKGAYPIEDFYHTDADAESALVTMYSDSYNNFAFIPEICGWNYSPYIALTNWAADDIIMAGSDEGDCEPERQYHDFRYDPTLNIVEAGYTMFYRSIHKCNLVLKYVDEDSDVKRRCRAEARVMRAFDHMMLAIYWGTPPIVEDILGADAQPANSASQEAVMDWVVSEINEALPDLKERKSPEDTEGAYYITKGFANAVKGKALLWKGDYAGAKSALKEVISSGKYKLVDNMQTLGHVNGKGSSEIIFEFNINAGNVVKSIYPRHSGNWMTIANWRLEFFAGQLTHANLRGTGWGWFNPGKDFCEALIANDGMDSERRKAWILTYDELLYNLKWASDGDNFTPGKSDAKATDPQRGVSKAYYGNAGYFCWKTVPHEAGDDLAFDTWGNWNRNFTIMRYAEVLLMYAEACAQTNDADGLQYLNEVQNRAKSKHVSTECSLREVQNEKRFEMWQDGCRFVDLVRWGNTLPLENADHEIWMLDDELRLGGAEHKAKVYLDPSSTFKGKGAGFKAKYSLLPFPQKVLDLNKALVQNPGW